MKARAFLFLFLCIGLAVGDEPDTTVPKGKETLLLQQPTVSKTHVVFVYANDLWIVGRAGGSARRLTSDVGAEFSPSLSPDGQWVAYSAQYEGNTDVYLLPIEGGTPRRLTWHPGGDIAQGWHPDGKRVLFTTSRDSGAPRRKLFLASIEGGTPKALDVPRVAHAKFDADASHIAYTPYSDAFRTWKRYRGGRVARIWIFDVKSHEVEEIPAVNASDTFPCWVDGVVYFASDRDDHMNLYRYKPGSKAAPEQITRFREYDIRNMSSGGGVVAFEQAGAIHLYDPATKATKRLRIRVLSDGLAARPRWQEVKGFVRSVSISPNGKRAVFEARGEIITVPKEHGAARNITQSPGAHDRYPSWSPDGKKIAWVSDITGEYQLLVRDRLGFGDTKTYDLGGGGYYYSPEWSPDGKHVLFRDKTNRLAYVTLDTGKITQVARNRGSLGVVGTSAVWAPDSEWIAFELRNERTMYDRIALYRLKDASTTVITDGFGEASDPAFSGDGKYLFFSASVNSGPKQFGLDMTTSASRRARDNLYVAVLKKDEKNPLKTRSDEGWEKEKKKPDPKKKEDGEEKEEAKEDAKKKKEGPSIDLEGLDQRILALPIGAGRFGNLVCTKDALFFVESGDGGPELKSFDFKERKAETVAKGVRLFTISRDGKSILTIGGGGRFGRGGGANFAIMSVKGGQKEPLRIDSVKVRVDPAKEWPQLLREAWRIERDYFYDPNMHGVLWSEMWERWSAFLPHVKHRSDLNLLIGELIGELACGHNYVGGGDAPRAASGVSVGLLGADLEEHMGRYRIRRIYKGQNWNPRLRAPLTEPGVNAREGDYLISVNGRELKTSDNVFEAFVDTAGKLIQIGLGTKSDGSDVRTVDVTPLGSEGGLRRMAWVESNRQRVSQLSGGRLGYIYMPNTGGAGMAAFDRDYYSQLDKEGLVIDERFNGGGQAADYVINVLGRKVWSYWMSRERWVGQSPFGTIEGPKVMIINESAGSGGDWMPWIFRNAGIGPLVGRRTWGGLVGLSGSPRLMDGGRVTAAGFGVMDTTGNWAVENVGVAPDYEVVQWPKQLIAGGDPQLEKAVEVALEMLKQRPKKPRPTYKPPVAR